MASALRIPTPAVPFDWLNPAPGAPHPLFPLGPPADFGGVIIPNPDNLQVLPDTQAPGDRLSGGKMSVENFHGKPQIKKMSARPQIDYDALAEQHGGTGAVDYDALAAAHGGSAGTSSTSAADNRSLLDRLANDPNNIPLDSYLHATEHGFANIGKGAAQAVQGTLSLLDPRAKDEHEKAVAAANSVALPVYRLFRSLGHTAEEAKALAQEYRRDGGPSLLEVGDVAGVTAGNLAAGEIAARGAGAVVRSAPKVYGAVSDVAQAAADRAASAARNVTPKQVAQGTGAVSGAVGGHGILSIPGAYYGAKAFGHVAEVILGKERASTPIFAKARSLDDAADALAEVIARDRAAQTQSASLGKLPATGAKPAAQTGEALGARPTIADLNPTPKKGSTAPRFTAEDRAAAQSLLKDALSEHTADVVDQALPGKNAIVKAQIETALKKGDVGAAESALDEAAKERNPAWTPFERKPVPSVNEIRERIQAEAKTPSARTMADLLDDRALQQEMKWNLERHGWSAESEARREFIARNSNYFNKSGKSRGYVEGEQVKLTKTPRAAGSGTASKGQDLTNDLTGLLEQSLDEVRQKQQAK